MALTPEQERLLDSCPVLSQMKEFFTAEASSSSSDSEPTEPTEPTTDPTDNSGSTDDTDGE